MHVHAAILSQPGTSQFGMIDLGHIDELARRLSSLVPPGLREGRDELQQNFKSVLQAGLGRLDLVTREEFDVQREVLLRTREQLETLQRAIAALEAQLAGAAGNPPQA
jgi:BMFP domain-containing protein YqiC